MKPLRIAFAAKQRAGKDSAAAFILSINKGTIKKFADPLYELTYFIQKRLGFPKEKDRWLLQTLGTDYARKRNPNIWIDKLFDSLPDTNEAILITDARFHNEFEACKKHGFMLVKIQASDQVRQLRGADKRAHASEVDMDEYTDYDYIIDNNGSLEFMQHQLIDMLEAFSKR